MILVDTNVLSEATRPVPDAKVRSWAMTHERKLWLSAIVLAELRGGIALMPSGKRRLDLEMQVESLALQFEDRLLPFGEAETRSYGIVLAAARRAGQPMVMADAMIAATAHAHGMSVATRDIAGFEGSGVSLINPWEG